MVVLHCSLSMRYAAAYKRESSREALVVTVISRVDHIVWCIAPRTCPSDHVIIVTNYYQLRTCAIAPILSIGTQCAGWTQDRLS